MGSCPIEIIAIERVLEYMIKVKEAPHIGSIELYGK